MLTNPTARALVAPPPPATIPPLPDALTDTRPPIVRAAGKWSLTLFWRALTPGGRPSRYWHAVTVYADSPTPPAHPDDVAALARRALGGAALPTLRPGYTWTGPYVYGTRGVRLTPGGAA